jgi:hypothetical protein
MRQEIVMSFPQKLIMMLIGVLCLGVMGSLLLAQDAEETEESPIPIDCSPQGLSDLNNLIIQTYYFDFGEDTAEITESFATIGSIFEEIARACGYIPRPEPRGKIILREMVDLLADNSEHQVGTDPDEALAQIDTLISDPIRGEALYNAEERTELNKRLGCVSCHQLGAAAPDTEEIWNYVVKTRLKLPEFEDYTAQAYIIESILLPDVYIIPSYTDLMPDNYGEQMSAQDLADILDYLYSFSADEN